MRECAVDLPVLSRPEISASPAERPDRSTWVAKRPIRSIAVIAGGT
jgi:hypothetical protein